MAKTWVTKKMQNYLFWIQKAQDILSWDYLNDRNDPNFVEMLKHLYPEAEDRMKLLNPWSYLGNIVWDKIKNFVWDPKSKFSDINYDVVVESILTRWEVLLKYTNTSATDLWLTEIDPSTYYNDWETEFIVKLYEKEIDRDYNASYKETYLYVQTFNWSTLKNKLFKIPYNNLNSISDWVSVPLNTIYQTKWLLVSQEVENLDKLVISIPVTNTPLTDILRGVIYSIDRKIAEAEKNYVDYVDQFKVFQNIDIPKSAYRIVNWWRVIDWDLLWKIVKTSDLWAVWDIRIIKNTNELLDKALERVEKQIVQISTMTDVPLEFFWIKTVTDSWNWKIVWYTAFYKRITKYRSRIEKGIREWFSTLNIEDTSIIWDAIIRMSDEDILANEAVKLQSKMTSLKRAIMKAQNVDEKEALIIIEEVKQDIKDWLLSDDTTTEQIIDSVNKTTATLNVD